MNRFHQIIDIPYSFVLIAFSHNTNFTGNIKKTVDTKLRHKQTGDTINFYDHWPDDVKQFVRMMRRSLVGYKGEVQVEDEQLKSE